MTVITVTGHRDFHPLRANTDLLREVLSRPDLTRVYTGMALGFDQYIAAQCLSDYDVPVTAAVPCDGQDAYWSTGQRSIYGYLLDQIAAQRTARGSGVVTDVNPGPYAAWKMHARNRYMIDRADFVLAYWDGRTSGGTYQAIQYAKSHAQIPVLNVFMGGC